MNDESPLPSNPLITAAALNGLHQQAFSWAMSQCHRRRSEAEDVLQQTYEQILSGRARFAGGSQLRTWLFAVIARTARGRRRTARLRELLLQRWWPSGADAGEAAAMPADAGAAARVRRALLALPQRQRDVLELVFYRDMSIEQAAEVMGIGLGSARTHYQRGKQALARVLAEAGVPA
jgi:RNA polymerase sigma-70 factor, ECF subfamily